MPCTYDIVRGGQAFYHKIVTDLREWNISADMWEGFKLETVTELPKQNDKSTPGNKKDLQNGWFAGLFITGFFSPLFCRLLTFLDKIKNAEDGT